MCMGDDVPALVTRVLRRVREGDDAARDELFALVYEELRSMAASQMLGQAPAHTLQATALVNEAYLRMGARVCGEPCWDPDFNCLDYFILMEVSRLPARYVQHFLQPGEARPATAVAV